MEQLAGVYGENKKLLPKFLASVTRKPQFSTKVVTRDTCLDHWVEYEAAPAEVVGSRWHNCAVCDASLELYHVVSHLHISFSDHVAALCDIYCLMCLLGFLWARRDG